jgi:cytochrome c biogenesis protein CcmG, thiol:disulfide interchange protein DsbE
MIRRRSWCRIGLILLVALGAGACTRPAGERTAAAAPLRSGDPAPDFEVRDVNGAPVKLSALAGRVRLLDFWATWCPPCRNEIPMLNDLHRQYADAGLTILGLSDEDPEAVRAFAEQVRIGYTSLVEASDVAERYGVLGLPTAFLVDREGHIVEMFFGEKSRADLEKRIRTALGLEPTVPEAV